MSVVLQRTSSNLHEYLHEMLNLHSQPRGPSRSKSLAFRTPNPNRSLQSKKINAEMHWTGRDRSGLKSHNYVSEALSSPYAYRWKTLSSSVPAG